MHFEHPVGDQGQLIRALSERCNAKKLCGGVLSRKCQFYSQNSAVAFLSTLEETYRGIISSLTIRL